MGDELMAAFCPQNLEISQVIFKVLYCWKRWQSKQPEKEVLLESIGRPRTCSFSFEAVVVISILELYHSDRNEYQWLSRCCEVNQTFLSICWGWNWSEILFQCRRFNGSRDFEWFFGSVVIQLWRCRKSNLELSPRALSSGLELEQISSVSSSDPVLI